MHYFRKGINVGLESCVTDGMMNRVRPCPSMKVFISKSMQLCFLNGSKFVSLPVKELEGVRCNFCVAIGDRNGERVTIKRQKKMRESFFVPDKIGKSFLRNL